MLHKQLLLEVYQQQKLKDKKTVDTKLQVAVLELILVKFCETGNNIVPPTSQKIATIKNRYVLIII